MPKLKFQISAPGNLEALFHGCRNVVDWPKFMPAVKVARFLEQEVDKDVVELTAEVNETLWNWKSKRTIDISTHSIHFERLSLPENVLFMRGTWHVSAIDTDYSQLTLSHEFEVCEGHKQQQDFIVRSIRRNSIRDICALFIFIGELEEKSDG